MSRLACTPGSKPWQRPTAGRWRNRRASSYASLWHPKQPQTQPGSAMRCGHSSSHSADSTYPSSSAHLCAIPRISRDLTGEPAVVAWANAQPTEDLYTTAITEAEMLFGLALLPAGRRQENMRRATETAFTTGSRCRWSRPADRGNRACTGRERYCHAEHSGFRGVRNDSHQSLAGIIPAAQKRCAIGCIATMPPGSPA